MQQRSANDPESARSFSAAHRYEKVDKTLEDN